MNRLLNNHKNSRDLTTLVENKTTYAADYSELNIFETHAIAEKVELKFDFPIIASMLTGKKIMHLDQIPSFDFYPGESVVVPAGERMIIDFPLATIEHPTQCLALAIDPSKISDVVTNFNHIVEIDRQNNNWSLDNMSSHLTNQPELNYLIERLVHTFTNNVKSKDIILDLMIQELIVRLLQTKAKYSILNDPYSMFSDTRIGMVIKIIKENITDKKINVDYLADKAHMSTSNFYKQFKNTLGISPVDYINTERIKFAKRLISTDTNAQISNIAFKSGFNSVSYFNRQFKKHELISPGQYRKLIYNNRQA